ncbi:hypothetical protein COCMIDRAFT_88820 [Bipolaris oryzae ATCC 44560]|uniref:Nascent polypeptide-associated complex subunit alpha-like UBA domain-containing protein n=1 Tax=Bipolaris oryzae ATCC 44560 TaxID=930090 RepID=W6ZCZ0_COCMI|nr:uncharacterized protein COCMIDRAFT_88820 [Bipolaris oryzae ATCC 44560]EUC47840.1 hypothetical protein COCMIDRAFT_88820 [Bipolaris oryzae ATCC 44560]
MAEPQPPTIHEGASTPALNDAASTPTNGAKKEVDGKALDKAMKGLSVKDKAEDEKKKNVKIDAGDVVVLVSELEITKAKATELLRANEGDAVKALVAFVTAAP